MGLLLVLDLELWKVEIPQRVSNRRESSSRKKVFVEIPERVVYLPPEILENSAVSGSLALSFSLSRWRGGIFGMKWMTEGG